jgi:8-oxo-dGTP pyrophosphatase MutT (NUDIX family)
MDDALDAFLAGRTPGTTEDVEWGNGIRLRRAAYLGTVMPPAAVISSVRAIVLRDDAVLVAEDADGLRHILPGGRIEAGEPLDAALRREIAEEVGWQVADLAPLGFLHFRHLTPKPAGYRYPYPSFVQVVYVATASDRVPEATLVDDYVVGATFLPVAEVRRIGLSPAERLFLDAARSVIQ